MCVFYLYTFTYFNCKHVSGCYLSQHVPVSMTDQDPPQFGTQLLGRKPGWLVGTRDLGRTEIYQLVVWKSNIWRKQIWSLTWTDIVFSCFFWMFAWPEFAWHVPYNLQSLTCTSLTGWWLTQRNASVSSKWIMWPEWFPVLLKNGVDQQPPTTNQADSITQQVKFDLCMWQVAAVMRGGW